MEDRRLETCDDSKANPNPQQGYSQNISHLLYRTWNQTYGSKKPSLHEKQTVFNGISRQFSEAMLQTGMYRDHGLNTSLDRSRVMVSTAIQNNRVILHHCSNQRNDPNGVNK